MPRVRLDFPGRIFSQPILICVTDVNSCKHMGHVELFGLLHQARVEFLAANGMTEMNIDGEPL